MSVRRTSGVARSWFEVFVPFAFPPLPSVTPTPWISRGDIDHMTPANRSQERHDTAKTNKTWRCQRIGYGGQCHPGPSHLPKALSTSLGCSLRQTKHAPMCCCFLQAGPEWKLEMCQTARRSMTGHRSNQPAPLLRQGQKCTPREPNRGKG